MGRQDGTPSRRAAGTAENVSHAKEPGRAVSAEVDGQPAARWLAAGPYAYSVGVGYVGGERQVADGRDTLIRVVGSSA